MLDMFLRNNPISKVGISKIHGMKNEIFYTITVINHREEIVPLTVIANRYAEQLLDAKKIQLHQEAYQPLICSGYAPAIDTPLARAEAESTIARSVKAGQRLTELLSGL